MKIVHYYDNCNYLKINSFPGSSYGQEGEIYDSSLFVKILTFWDKSDDIVNDKEIQKFRLLGLEFCYGCLDSYYGSRYYYSDMSLNY